MADALQALAGMDEVTVGAAFLRSRPGEHAGAAKAEAYARLVRHVDGQLAETGEVGMLVMDGDGTDPMYRLAHRDLKLATRHLLEDPLFQHSHHSQPVQIADLVAYAAYMHLARIPEKQAMWDWWTRAAGDEHREPVDLQQA